MTSRVSFCTAALVAISLAGAASAQAPPRLELGWQVPPECPDEAAFRDQVLRLAGPDARANAELRAKVAIERASDRGFKLTLHTESDGRAGTRVLEGASCSAVVDAAALTLALILNPEAGAAEPSTAEPPPEPSGPAPASPPPVVGPPAAQASPKAHLVAAAGIGVVVGEMPSVGPELTLGLGVGVSAGWIFLLGSYVPEQQASVDGHPAAGGALWLASALALGCWDLAASSLVVAPCAGVELSRLQGSGEGVSNPEDAAIYWTSPALGGAFHVDLSERFALRLSALGFVPLSRPALFLEQIGEVYRPEPVAGRAQIGLVVDLL